MLKRNILITLASLVVLVIILSISFLPLFSDEIISITVTGGFFTEKSVVTIYSNRVVVIKSSKRLFASILKLTKDDYEKFLNQVNSFSHDGHLTSSQNSLNRFDGYTYSLRIDGQTYYTSFTHGDESLDNLILLVDQLLY